MTVKELRASLANYPEDAVVFLYSELGECDGFIDKVTIDKPMTETLDDGSEYLFSPYGCNADSEAQEYWLAQGKDKPIVFLHSTNWFRDFSIKEGE